MGVKSIIDDYKRKKAIKIITYNLGRIEETDDAIYCYVDAKKFSKMNGLINNNRIGLRFGFANVLGDTFVIKKDIVFVFDGIVFEDGLLISIPHSLKFSNCVFTDCVSISGAKSIEFDGNVCAPTGAYIHVEGRTEKVKFTKNYIFACFNNAIRISNCEMVEMSDTEFKCGLLNVAVNNLVMNNSYVYSDAAVIDSDKVELLDGSLISCSHNIILNVDEGKGFSNINASCIICNGLSLAKYGDYSYINRLREERQKLVNTLATIKKTEEEHQRIDVKKYSEELKGRPSSRRLKK